MKGRAGTEFLPQQEGTALLAVYGFAAWAWQKAAIVFWVEVIAHASICIARLVGHSK
jgi:hypothetical protein